MNKNCFIDWVRRIAQCWQCFVRDAGLMNRRLLPETVLWLAYNIHFPLYFSYIYTFHIHFPYEYVLYILSLWIGGFYQRDCPVASLQHTLCIYTFHIFFPYESETSSRETVLWLAYNTLSCILPIYIHFPYIYFSVYFPHILSLKIYFPY